MYNVRFAPSPSGFLHVGNIRMALINYLFARHNNATFYLRFDDTDTSRSSDVYKEAIKKDLDWLSLTPDQVFSQSSRLNIYEKEAHILREKGRLYACFETPEELALKRKALLAQGKPPRYDREGLFLSSKEQQAYKEKGRRPHWRFRLSDGPIVWEDMTRGRTCFDSKNLSDPVVIRENGDPVYLLASTIDDRDTDITHIIRGEDHVSNTAINIDLAQALYGAKALPHFAHVPLIIDKDGGTFSKRLGSLSVQSLRENGITPHALLCYLSRLGTSLPIEPISLNDIINSFSLESFSRAAAKFSLDELIILNRKIIHKSSYAAMQPHFPVSISEDMWRVIQPNISTLADITLWHHIITERPSPSLSTDDKEAIRTMLPLLVNDDFTSWIDALKKAGFKGKSLFMPLRRALTGMDHGPDLMAILTILGVTEVQHRLSFYASSS